METARALTENLAALLRREHDALAEFLVALADFDRRRAWAELGHSSLFYFLRRELRLSSAAAQYRKVAAELIQQIPGMVEPLRRGDLCLTSIIEASRVVTPENWETVLPRFYGLSRREAMEVVAELQPHPAPPLRTVVTPVRSTPVPRRDAAVPQALALGDSGEPRMLSDASASPDGTSLIVTSPGEVEITVSPSSVPRSILPVTPRGQLEVAPLTVEPLTVEPLTVEPLTVEPLTADLSRLHVTVSKGFLRKLDEARDALSHAMPGATEAELLEAGLDLLLAQAAKRRGLVDKPQKKVRPSKGDRIPAPVRREVWKRDGGKCRWVLESGEMCGATRNLELDHIHPRSLGGPSTADNLRVVCRFHNQRAARLVLGDDLVDRCSSGTRAGRPSREERGLARAAATLSAPG
jgi:hypothetical protein